MLGARFLFVLWTVLYVTVCEATGSFHSFTVKDSLGSDVPLNTFKDKKAVLVVNVASFCGFTDSNYRQLQRLYERYADDGLEVLAFPCNQFGAQEPGTQEEISQFLDQNYGITFPVMGKVDVNGEGSEPLFSWLKQASGDVLNIRWNFTKFLVSGGGTTVSRFSHEVDPEDIEVHIRNALSFDEKVDEEVEREL